ncbi:MAG: DUF47 family protein [Dysgonamonadaceae bacterium]|jgi:uncharacterized protein Yka (UPF0111/DUF47 family)|nr:DUF47 family protein [Dysgonamonadaceae bacterium]
MKANVLLNFFAPKDAKFIPLLVDTASILVQAANLLPELFQEQDETRRKELGRLIKVEEVKGDKVTGRILKALNENFITPFDKEDIDALADKMDDVIDSINRSSQKVLLYSPKNLPECTLKLANTIKKGALEIQGGIKELENFKRSDKRLRMHYKEIKRLEEEADVLYENGIMNLFKDETNTVELIKLEKIIQDLEKTANKINNTGKILKTIFVKYA